MASGTSSASEVAQVIASLVPFLPNEAASDLRRLLGHDLSAPTTGELREARLGLLVTLIAQGTGEVPSTAVYDEAREQEATRGYDWPSHSGLIRAYGHWLKAVRAAMRLYFDGGKARVKASGQNSRWSTAYSQPEILDAIKRCRGALDNWPTQWEYEEWARLARMAARAAGLPDPRVPVLGPIRTQFGSWDKALAAARRHATSKS